MTDPHDHDADDETPADALSELFGGGVPDLGSLVDGLAAVQNIQSASYVGSAGGGLVRIRANGRMEVESVEISPDVPTRRRCRRGGRPGPCRPEDLTAQIAAAQQQAMGPLGGILGG